jgi:hypothetical protein
MYDELFGLLSFAGTLSDTTGNGDTVQVIPGLTADLGAETCSTGPLTWTASAPATGAASTPRVTGATVHINWTRDSAGHVSETVSRG